MVFSGGACYFKLYIELQLQKYLLSPDRLVVQKWNIYRHPIVRATPPDIVEFHFCIMPVK